MYPRERPGGIKCSQGPNSGEKCPRRSLEEALGVTRIEKKVWKNYFPENRVKEAIDLKNEFKCVYQDLRFIGIYLWV